MEVNVIWYFKYQACYLVLPTCGKNYEDLMCKLLCLLFFLFQFRVKFAGLHGTSCFTVYQLLTFLHSLYVLPTMHVLFSSAE